jgi:hypothetical protein
MTVKLFFDIICIEALPDLICIIKPTKMYVVTSLVVGVDNAC